MSGTFPDENLASAAEVPSIIEGRLENDSRIIVEQNRFQDELRSRGFGDKEDSGEYILKSYEGLYLLHRNQLILISAQKITFESLVHIFARRDKDVITNFLIYRDLRNRGYVAKEGFGFGNDFRVYERGEYEKKPAKYVVFGVSEGANIKARALVAAVGQIEKMGKEAVIAVIERRGEVIYYKASKMRFSENRRTK
jgi:tRNA-intron endonuclease